MDCYFSRISYFLVACRISVHENTFEFSLVGDYLRSHVLSFPLLMRLALSMVEGLAYLHSEDTSVTPAKPIIAHMDFKSRNVLVKDNLTCCIADFGSAAAFPKDQKVIEAHPQVGTKRYMAPEVLISTFFFFCSDYHKNEILLDSGSCWVGLFQRRCSY